MSLESTELGGGRPGSVGMDEGALERAGSLLERAVAEAQLGAASLTVARRNSVVFARGFGRRWPDPQAPEVDENSVFLLASITKPVTVCALMMLVERGLVSLRDSVSHYLPEYIGGQRHLVQVSHLLSHVSGMPDMLPENRELRVRNAPVEEFVGGALTTPLLFTPATQLSYQSMGTLLAATIVERQTGMKLREFEKQEIFGPLGMTRSALGMGSLAISDTVWCGDTKPETGEAANWGPNSSYWRDFGCPWGGMHSSGPDLAILLQAMLNGGAYGGERILCRASVEAMTRNRNPPGVATWGLGWAVAESPVWNFFSELASSVAFGHVGATGTVAWADPERELSCVVLTNQMVESGSLLRRVSNAVSAAVVD